MFFDELPRQHFSKFDPAVISSELATEGQEKIDEFGLFRVVAEHLKCKGFSGILSNLCTSHP